jgi:hypothetical protein
MVHFPPRTSRHLSTPACLVLCRFFPERWGDSTNGQMTTQPSTPGPSHHFRPLSPPALLLVLTLGAFAPMSSGESRPTLQFAGATPATGAIEDAFKMALDNPIAEPFVSGRLQGEQNVTILLGRHPPARTMPIRPGQ